MPTVINNDVVKEGSHTVHRSENQGRIRIQYD